MLRETEPRRPARARDELNGLAHHASGAPDPPTSTGNGNPNAPVAGELIQVRASNASLINSIRVRNQRAHSEFTDGGKHWGLGGCGIRRADHIFGIRHPASVTEH